MRKNIKGICYLAIIIFFFSILPVSVFAVSNNGGTVRIKYGDTAQLANASIVNSNKRPNKANTTFITHTESFEAGSLTPANVEYIYIRKDSYSPEYEFQYWLINGPGYENVVLSDTTINIADGVEDGAATINVDNEAYVEQETGFVMESGVRLFYYQQVTGNWTIEPIFAKVSPYTVYLSYDGQDTVDKGTQVSLDLIVEGGSYDDLSAIITYDSDLFIYESCSNESITVDETSSGTLKLTATDLGKDEDDETGTLVFTAKATSTASSGTFAVTGAKVGTALEAVSEDALEAKKGDSVTIGVNPATQVTIKFFNDWLGTEGEEYGLLTYVTLGNDSPDIVLDGVIYEYDAENYVYTFDTQGLDYQLTTYAGRNAIKIIKPDRDLIVKVSKTAVVPGKLTTRSFTVGASEYTLAVFAGTAEDGKTMFYDGEQMVKTSEGYVCIIGGADTAATKTKITQETGTDLVMTVTGDVNQTGVIDINDAQLVSDLYNGKYTDGFETVAMVKYLAADVNGDGAVSATDIAAVVQNSGFVY